MRISADLACLRRRLLRRALADAGLCPGEVALAIGVSPEYVNKMLAGSRVITDGVAWRLFCRFHIPLHTLEEPHNCPDAPPGACRYLPHGLD